MRLSIIVEVLVCLWSAQAFSLAPKSERTSSALCAADDRRAFLTSAAVSLVLLPRLSEAAEDEDLTSKLFNPDGSLKDEDMPTEAKSRTVSFSWGATDDQRVAVDGETSEKTGPVQISYSLPLKWASGEPGGDPRYFDRSEGVNALACGRISVFQAPNKASVSRLEKAATVGVAKALDLGVSLPALAKADLIGGRTRVGENGQKYWDFTLGVAPKTCDDSSENLGLGFCPFDSIFLLSAAVVDDKLYALAVECDKGQWKRANSDLKRVQSSFSVMTM